MLFEPSVIEDFKRRLSGLELADDEPESGQPPTEDAAMDVDAFISSLPAAAASEPTSTAPSPPPPEEPAPAKSGFKPSFKAAAFAPAQPESAPEMSLTSAMEDDVDGAPVAEEDVDGAPVIIDLVDGAPVQDVDGTASGQDVDGAPLGQEDGVDGAPVGTTVEEKARPETVVLEGSDDGEAMDMGSDDDDIFR